MAVVMQISADIFFVRKATAKDA